MRWPIFALMAFVLIFIASPTTAQNGVRYPESFQITKNGTTVLLEDYASAPRAHQLMPSLIGKYVFTDIVTGRVFYADFKEMQASGGVSNRLAPVYELQVVFKKANRRLFDIVADAYARNGGTGLPRVVLPGLAALTNARTLDPYGVAYGGGRADVRLSVDKDGELYLLSKTDGMIRKLTGVVTPPPSGPR